MGYFVHDEVKISTMGIGYFTLPGKERISANTRRYEDRLRNTAIAILGGRCASPNCRWINEDGSKGCSDRRCLQIDHIKGNGREQRKRLSQNEIFRSLILDPNRAEWFQLLCCNCHFIKTIECGDRNVMFRGRRPVVPTSIMPPTEKTGEVHYIAGERVITKRGYDDTPDHLLK